MEAIEVRKSNPSSMLLSVRSTSEIITYTEDDNDDDEDIINNNHDNNDDASLILTHP